MKNKILEILDETRDTSYDLITLANIYYDGNYTPEDLNELQKALEELIKEFKVYFTKKEKYILLKNSHLKAGTLQVIEKNNKIFGFVLQEGEDLFVPNIAALNGALDGDKVLVEITELGNPSKGKKTECKVVNIIERNLDNIIAEVVMVENKPTFVLKNKNLNYKLDVVSYPDNIVDGTVVVLKIIDDKIKLKQRNYKAQVISVLGHKNEPRIDIKEVAAQMGVRTEWPDKVLEEVKNIPSSLSADDYKDNRRVDRRDEIIFTIDGKDTKDIDDAISVKKLVNGNYLLGVHIADVNNYVKVGSDIRKEAELRGNSFYLADSVYPMLPVELSNGICSLNPNVDRLAKSCIMEISPKGKLISSEITLSIINSKKKMNYDDVNKVLEGNSPEDYKEFETILKDMQELSHILRKEKINRGFIDFDTNESKILVDENGLAIGVEKRVRKDAEKMIEDFMIAANEAVATYVTNLSLPFIYRVHDKPSPEKLKEFLAFLNAVGMSLKEKLRVENVTPREIQKVLLELKEQDQYQVYANEILRCMAKAEYSAENIGHFGIASLIYTHFTSPIRRYSDLVVHTLLDEYIFSGRLDNNIVKRWENKLPIISEHISKTERSADEVEREVDKMKIAEYMESHIGEEYEVIIDGVMNNGFYVETANGISGFVNASSLKGHYELNPELKALINHKNNHMYRLGDKLKVVCTSSSKETRRIDFELSNENHSRVFKRREN